MSKGQNFHLSQQQKYFFICFSIGKYLHNKEECLCHKFLSHGAYSATWCGYWPHGEVFSCKTINGVDSFSFFVNVRRQLSLSFLLGCRRRSRKSCKSFHVIKPKREWLLWGCREMVTFITQYWRERQWCNRGSGARCLIKSAPQPIVALRRRAPYIVCTRFHSQPRLMEISACSAHAKTGNNWVICVSVNFQTKVLRGWCLWGE